MANKKKIKQARKGIAIVPILIGIAVLGVLAAAGGFTFAATQETRDSFCASCHTQPESTFYERSTAAQQVDLASFHTTKKTRCIDCHSGQGLTGRMSAELLGARNAFLWYTGTAVQPAKLTIPIDDANCLKCHQQVTSRNYVPTSSGSGITGGFEEGRNNHWHAFLARWQAAASNAGSCTSCHPGHSTDGSAQTGFQNQQTTRSVCDACHQVLREGGEGGG